MASHGGGHVVGYRPAQTNGGWIVAIGVSALAVALWIGAWTIHRNTFNDPRSHLSPGSQQSAIERGAAVGHGAPAGDHGGAGGDHSTPAPTPSTPSGGGH